MAKRMKSKIQPAELKIVLQMRGSGYHYVDLSQCASIINRRFYRQGLNWAVSHFTFYKTSATETGSEGVTVSKLPTSWIMSNAWEKSFRVWQQMIKNATDDSEMQSIKGKFLDFKVFMNSRHHSAGVGSNLLPIDSAANAATAGQWQMSDITIPAIGTGAVTDYEFVAIGANDPGAGASGKDAKSIIQGYADSRALPSPEDPNVPADASLNWMSALFREGNLQDNAVLGMLEITGDNPPYPFEGDASGTADTMYPGGETQLPSTRVVGAAFFNAGTNANKVIVEGDSFPCGLVEFNNASDDDVSVIVHLVPGTHRGYLAESMVDM